MVTGQFFGGVASGFQNQEERNTADRALAIKQQQYDIQNQTDATATIDQQISKTLQIAAQTAQIAQDNGKPPDLIARAIQPIIDSAASLAQRAPNGQDYVKRVQAVGNAILLRSGVQQQASPGTDTSPAPTAVQPTAPIAPIAPTDTFSPGEIARANPPLSGGTPFSTPTAPITPPVTPIAPAPNQRVAQGFSDAGITPQPASMVQPEPVAARTPDEIKAVEKQTEQAAQKDAEDTINFTHLVPLPEPMTLKGGQVLNPRTIRGWAVQLSLGNSTPLVRQPPDVRAAVGNDASDLNTALKRSGADVNMSTADYKANTSALTQLAKVTAAIDAFERTAIKNGDVLVELANKVDKTGMPIIERWYRQGRQALGNPDVAEFMFQMNLFRSEVAKITTNPNLTGILTDEARKEVENGLPNSSSAAQVDRIVERAKSDFTNRQQANAEAVNNVKSRFGFPKPMSQQNSPSQKPPSTGNQGERQRLKELYGLK